MPRSSEALKYLPPEVSAALTTLGEQIMLARKRRKESQRLWAERIGISAPTMARLEAGDPAVSMGNYATALWLMGRSHALTELADPALDQGALEADIRAIKQVKAVRTRASVKARLEAQET